MSASRVEETQAEYGKNVATASPAEDRVFLYNVSWETYERLLEERGECTNPRFAYDEGTLEIMSPHWKHENAGALIGYFICVLTEEFKLKRKSVMHMTCKRSDKERGLEPDGSFYIKNEALMRGVTDLDLSIHPPPDLMIEIDISRSSMSKFGIYEALGVSEIWLYDGIEFQFFAWRKTKYEKFQESPTFPGVAIGEGIPRFIAESLKTDEETLLANFRTWVRQQLEGKK